jgi:hypothetical protein
MTHLMDDFRHLGEWLRGEWRAPDDDDVPWAVKDYKLVEDIDDLRRYTALYQRKWIAVDTERHGPKAWSVQFSLWPGTGRMILADNTACLEMLQSYRAHWEPEVILHNAGQDLDMMERMGLHAPSFQDTLQQAYHQCNLPQGLKALAYRLFGVTMQSWADTVWPASVAKIVDWMEDALTLCQTNLQDTQRQEMKMRTCLDCGRRGKQDVCKHCGSGNMQSVRVTHVPSAAEGILKHVLVYTAKTSDEDEPYDPWKALARMRIEGLRGKKIEGWEFEYLESELGPVPILGIGNCDLEQAVQYGCGDADVTGQVAEALAAGRADGRWSVDPSDWDQ